jgi:hypothetical protein
MWFKTWRKINTALKFRTKSGYVNGLLVFVNFNLKGYNPSARNAEKHKHCVFCLNLLFCVLFVCKCVLEYFHRDIGTLFDYRH